MHRSRQVGRQAGTIHLQDMINVDGVSSLSLIIRAGIKRAISVTMSRIRPLKRLFMSEITQSRNGMYMVRL